MIERCQHTLLSESDANDASSIHPLKEALHMAIPSQQTQQFICNPLWPFLTLRSTFNSALAYKTHQHDTVSLGVVLDGTTHSTVNGDEQTLHAGDMVLIPHHCAHSCNPNGGSRSYHMLYIDKQWCIEVLGGDPNSHYLGQPPIQISSQLNDGARHPRHSLRAVE